MAHRDRAARGGGRVRPEVVYGRTGANGKRWRRSLPAFRRDASVWVVAGNGPFATGRQAFSVTHAPSGDTAAHSLTRGEAVRLARLLARIAPDFAAAEVRQERGRKIADLLRRMGWI